MDDLIIVKRSGVINRKALMHIITPNKVYFGRLLYPNLFIFTGDDGEIHRSVIKASWWFNGGSWEVLTDKVSYLEEM